MQIEELITIEASGGLEVEATYVVDNLYDFPMLFTAISPEELNKHAVSADGRYEILYSTVNKKVEYLLDNLAGVEGYYDWYSNVTDCKNMLIEGSCNATFKDCNNLKVGVNNSGAFVGVNNSTIGSNNKLYLTNVSNANIGDYNGVATESGDGTDYTITLADLSSLTIGDRNKSISTTGMNIIGSDNVDITITGDSNVVKSGSVGVSITGYNNTINKSRYIAVEGGFNAITDSSCISLNSAYSNDVESSNDVTIIATNNNTIYTDELTVGTDVGGNVGRDAFLDYRTIGGVRAVTNIVNPINLQADNNARTLIIDQSKFRGESETKSNKKYNLVDGQWEEQK